MAQRRNATALSMSCLMALALLFSGAISVRAADYPLHPGGMTFSTGYSRPLFRSLEHFENGFYQRFRAVWRPSYFDNTGYWIDVAGANFLDRTLAIEFQTQSGPLASTEDYKPDIFALRFGIVHQTRLSEHSKFWFLKSAGAGFSRFDDNSNLNTADSSLGFHWNSNWNANLTLGVALQRQVLKTFVIGVEYSHDLLLALGNGDGYPFGAKDNYSIINFGSIMFTIGLRTKDER